MYAHISSPDAHPSRASRPLLRRNRARYETRLVADGDDDPLALDPMIADHRAGNAFYQRRRAAQDRTVR